MKRILIAVIMALVCIGLSPVIANDNTSTNRMVEAGNLTATDLAEAQNVAYIGMMKAMRSGDNAGAESLAKVLYLTRASEMVHPVVQLERAFNKQTEDAPRLVQNIVRLFWEANGAEVNKDLVKEENGAVFFRVMDAFIRGVMTEAEFQALEKTHMTPRKSARPVRLSDE
jgi:hypothetical protein